MNKSLWDVCRHIKYRKFFKAQVTLKWSLQTQFIHNTHGLNLYSIPSQIKAHSEDTICSLQALVIKRFSVTVSTSIKGYIAVKLMLKPKQCSTLHSFVQRYTCVLDQKVYSSCGICTGPIFLTLQFPKPAKYFCSLGFSNVVISLLSKHNLMISLLGNKLLSPDYSHGKMKEGERQGTSNFLSIQHASSSKENQGTCHTDAWKQPDPANISFKQFTLKLTGAWRAEQLLRHRNTNSSGLQ